MDAKEAKLTLQHMFSLYSAMNADIAPFSSEIPDTVKPALVTKHKELANQMKLYLAHYEKLLDK